MLLAEIMRTSFNPSSAMSHDNDDDILNNITIGNKAKVFDVLYRCAGADGRNRAEWLAPSLECAASAGDADLLEIRSLLDCGAVVNAIDGDGRTALQLLAANKDNPGAAAVLLAAGANARYRRSAGDSTALELAVDRRNVAVVRTMLQSDINPQAPKTYRYTALHTAAAGNEVDAIRVIIEAGEDIHVLDGRGRTPLHIASEENNAEAVKALCGLGANENKLSVEGRAPLHCCSRPPGCLRAVVALLDAGADANLRQSTSLEFSPLDMAASLGDVDMVRTLLEHGADATATDSSGITALHHAACKNKIGAMHLLIAAGAELNASDVDGQTPLHHACENLKVEAADVLLGLGARVNAPDILGETPLHRAARASNEDSAARIAEVLLMRWDADETAVDARGRTPARVIGRDAKREFALRHTPPSPSVLGLLVNARAERAERAWRRRGFLVMCRAHPDRAKPNFGFAKLSEHAGRASRQTRLMSRNRAKSARVEEGEGDVAGNNGGRGITHWQVAEGASVAGVAAKVVGMEEGLFRHVINFL